MTKPRVEHDWWADVRRLGRLARKELRETLRDRRTVITLVLMPLLVYPLISLSFNKSVLHGAAGGMRIIYTIGVAPPAGEEFVQWLIGWGGELLQAQTTRFDDGGSGEPLRAEYALSPYESLMVGVVPDALLEPQVAQEALHLGVRVTGGQGTRGAALRSGAQCELIYHANSPLSRRALRLVEDRLRVVNQAALESRLARAGLAAEVPARLSYRVVAAARSAPFSLATLVPLVLILMTITGAVYPAIDLTAGERERGTLETLIAAPISRLALLLAKYLAVLTVAVLTALVNLVAMTVTIMSSSLRGQLFPDGLSLVLMLQIFALMVLFAAFFSAILLALTSFARSFKEAQAYLIPLMLLAISPGLLSLIPGLQLSRLLALTPLLNIVLLSRDLLEDGAGPGMAVLAVASTALYAVAAIVLAARVFGTDAVLYASRGSWSDLFRRPVVVRLRPTVHATFACLAVMFPCFFLLGNLAPLLARQRGPQLLLQAAVSVVVFVGCPTLFALAQRVRWRDGFRCRRAVWRAVPGAACLGLALWPFAYELFLVGKMLGLATLDADRFAEMEQLLREVGSLSPALILLTLALVQPVCEELFFRGYLYQGLRDRFEGVGVILASGLLFALFHVLNPATLTPERFLPSLLLGLFLGWVSDRAGSVLPGIGLHVVHNGLLLGLVQYRDLLVARGWDLPDRTHLPVAWLLGAAILVGVGITLVVVATRRGPSVARGEAEPNQATERQAGRDG